MSTRIHVINYYGVYILYGLVDMALKTGPFSTPILEISFLRDQNWSRKRAPFNLKSTISKVRHAHFVAFSNEYSFSYGFGIEGMSDKTGTFFFSSLYPPISASFPPSPFSPHLV